MLRTAITGAFTNEAARTCPEFRGTSIAPVPLGRLETEREERQALGPGSQTAPRATASSGPVQCTVPGCGPDLQKPLGQDLTISDCPSRRPEREN